MASGGAMFGLEDAQMEALTRCLGAQRMRYEAGETLSPGDGEPVRLFLILSGRLEIGLLDREGNHTPIETLGAGDAFSEAPLPGSPVAERLIAALEPCEVLSIPGERALRPCASACPAHIQLMGQVFTAMNARLSHMRQTVDVLRQKTIRKKLLTWLMYECESRHSKQIELEISLGELAARLCVDRCAMMREIRRMKAEGLINSRGRHFELME